MTVVGVANRYYKLDEYVGHADGGRGSMADVHFDSGTRSQKFHNSVN